MECNKDVCMYVFTLVKTKTNLETLMEAARTSKMLVNFYHTTWRYNPEDSHLRTHRENLKSYLETLFLPT
jgi:hypothetical protein